MSTYKDKYLAALAEAKALADNSDNTPEANDAIRAKLDEANDLKAKADAAAESASLRDDISAALLADTGADAKAAGKNAGDVAAKSLGEHFLKSAGERLVKQASRNQMQISTPEFKAASAPQVSPVAGTVPVSAYGTIFDRTIVNQKRETLVVADVMGSVNISGASITYLVEKLNRIAEGGPAMVAEGGKKPYIRYDQLDLVTEALKKVAVLNKQSEEMMSDYDFIKSYIDNMLVYDLSLMEEAQLLKGDGIGSNILGLLNRPGLQNFDIAGGKEIDGIAKAKAMIPRATGMMADAIMLNDEDYLTIQLAKDANNQYYAGGPFTGQYGNGGIIMNPAPWGLKAVVTPAVEKGTYVLGAFRQGATVIRKGGVRIDSTNTNVDDFENNLVTLRAEERLGLMVPRPAAFVTGSFGAAAGV